ncbi:MAG: PAS domain S-box protein [Elusimicrobia bacterium]|nr:PAS domain S-box protein [Elusimicrobiota bacterium]
MADKQQGRDKSAGAWASFGQALRRRAEEKAAHLPENRDTPSPEEIRRTFHELRVRQIELEMQNEELRRTQAELAAVRTALRKSNLYLDSMIACANTPVIVWDPRFKIIRLNRAFETLLGRKCGEVAGKSVEIIFSQEHQPEYMERIRRMFSGERWEALELKILHQDGSLRTVLWNSAAIFEEDGKTPLAAIAQGLDITLYKRKEMQLRERNEELSRFAYAVSHDLKSPLVTIKTFISYLEEQDIPRQDSAAIAKDFSFINTAADKMSRLLDELLALSRVEQNINAHVEIPLRALMEEALALVAGRISECSVKALIIDEMVTLFGVETVTLSGDRQRLLEVFQNLFDNAAKFMGEQPDPLIEAGVDLSGAEPVFFVRDNGIGIDPRHQAKIFGLFEKLDSVTEGTGMGLALVRRIIEAHGGRIWVESEGPGRGTTFRFTLANATKISGGLNA